MASRRGFRRSSLHHVGFFQPRQPAFWLYVVIVVATGVVALAEQSFYRNISASGWALSWLLLALYALPVFLVVYFLDLYEREPLSLVAAALVWGAVAATTLSAIGNLGWGLTVARVGGPEFAARWTAALTAPFVEETLKGCGVVLIYLIARDEIDDVMDGFVYGAVCGLGFAIVEDVFYFMSVFGGQPAGVLQGFFLRVVASGLYSHVLYTGLVGMAIGVVVSRRATEPLGRRLWIAAGLCALAVFGHFLWNSPAARLLPCGAVDRRRLADGAGRDGGQRAAVAGVRGYRGLAGPASGTALVAGFPLAGGRPRRHLRRGAPGARLAQAPSRRPCADAPARGVSGVLAAASTPTRTGEPRHGGVQGAR